MIAVIFETWSIDGHRSELFNAPRQHIEHHASPPGLISIESFRSLCNPYKHLSLAFFTNETAVLRWPERLNYDQRTELNSAQLSEPPDRTLDFRLRIASVSHDIPIIPGHRTCNGAYTVPPGGLD